MKLSFQHERTAASPIAPTRAEFPPLSGADIAGMVTRPTNGWRPLPISACQPLPSDLRHARRSWPPGREPQHRGCRAPDIPGSRAREVRLRRDQRGRRHDGVVPRIESEHPPRGRRSPFLRGLPRLLQRGAGHDLLCQCRSHPGTVARSFRHYRAPGHGLAAWTVFRVDLRGPNSRAAKGSFSAAGFAWRSGGGSQAQEGRVRSEPGEGNVYGGAAGKCQRDRDGYPDRCASSFWESRPITTMSLRSPWFERRRHEPSRTPEIEASQHLRAPQVMQMQHAQQLARLHPPPAGK